MKPPRLTPAQAVERGLRLLAQRRAAEARSRRPAWSAPGIVETTVARVSPPAPERWPRVWRRPGASVFAASPEVEKTDMGASSITSSPPSAGEGGRGELRNCEKSQTDRNACLDATSDTRSENDTFGEDITQKPNDHSGSSHDSALEGIGPTGCKARPATGREKPAELSTERPQRVPGRAGGLATRKTRSASVGEGKKPTQNIPQNIPASVPKGVEPVKRGAANPLKREAKPGFQQNPTSAAKPQHPPGAWPIADLGPNQCRFACTPDDALQHRFCGAPTEIGAGNLHGSWCAAHLAVVWGQGTRAERMADWTPKAVRVG